MHTTTPHGWVVWICRPQKFRAFAHAPRFRAFAPHFAHLLPNAQHTTRDPAPSTLNRGHALEASHARDELVGLALVVALVLHEQLRVLQIGGDPLKVGKVGHWHRREVKRGGGVGVGSTVKSWDGMNCQTRGVCFGVSRVSRICYPSNISRC